MILKKGKHFGNCFRYWNEFYYSLIILLATFNGFETLINDNEKNKQSQTVFALYYKKKNKIFFCLQVCLL